MEGAAGSPSPGSRQGKNAPVMSLAVRAPVDASDPSGPLLTASIWRFAPVAQRTLPLAGGPMGDGSRGEPRGAPAPQNVCQKRGNPPGSGSMGSGPLARGNIDADGTERRGCGKREAFSSRRPRAWEPCGRSLWDRLPVDPKGGQSPFRNAECIRQSTRFPCPSNRAGNGVIGRCGTLGKVVKAMGCSGPLGHRQRRWQVVAGADIVAANAKR